MTNAVRMAPIIYQVTRAQQVRVPEQVATLVRDARETAPKLGGKLGLFHATVMNLSELHRAKDNYLLAVDPKTMPKEEGWYRVYRDISIRTVTFTKIESTEADKITRAGIWPDALYVTSSAVSAANEGRPVALGVNDGSRVRGYLYAYVWSQGEARVAVSGKQAEPSQAQAGREATVQSELASLLRVGKGQKVVVTSNGERIAEMKFPESATVHIE